MGTDAIRLGRDAPTLLFKQLVVNGFAILDNPVDSVTLEAVDLLTERFRLPHDLKQAAATPASAAVGRGYISLPDKEVLEVKQDREKQGLQPDVRLVVHEVFMSLHKTAATVLQALFASDADSGLHATEQQVQAWVGQPAAPTAGSSSSSSLLHVSSYQSSGAPAPHVLHGSSYKSSSASPPYVLGGAEAHIDRGLLTLVADSGPGLQVLAQDGSWVPVSPSAHQLVVVVGHTLHWATAGRLPAAKHRIVTPTPGSSSSSSSSSSSTGGPRLSLAFKLRAAAGAAFDPAAITGIPSSKLDCRHRVLKRTHESMAAFDTTHQSLHNSQELSQQQHGHQQASKRPCTEAVDAAASQHPAKTLTLKLRDQSKQLTVKVEYTICMGSLLQIYFQHWQVPPARREGYKLVYDGFRPVFQATPRDLSMQDGDVIDIVLEQIGD